MQSEYVMPESLRQSLLVPPMKYHDGVLPAELAKEIAETAPAIPSISAGMAISAAVRVLGEAREEPTTETLTDVLWQPIAA